MPSQRLLDGTFNKHAHITTWSLLESKSIHSVMYTLIIRTTDNPIMISFSKKPPEEVCQYLVEHYHNDLYQEC